MHRRSWARSSAAIPSPESSGDSPESRSFRHPQLRLQRQHVLGQHPLGNGALPSNARRPAGHPLPLQHPRRPATAPTALANATRRLRAINIGVESGDPEILRRIRKEVDLASVVDAFERCRREGVRTYATLLVGAPGETDASITRTRDFALRLRPSLVNFHIAIAYPGTPLYDEAVALGQVEPRWWARQVRKGFDPRRATPFEARWGWVADGALRLPSFAAESWQRRLTRSWYLRPAFVWDSAVFSLRQPYFLRHLFSLGRELLPIAKLRTLLPGYTAPPDERPGFWSAVHLRRPSYTPRVSSHRGAACAWCGSQRSRGERLAAGPSPAARDLRWTIALALIVVCVAVFANAAHRGLTYDDKYFTPTRCSGACAA